MAARGTASRRGVGPAGVGTSPAGGFDQQLGGITLAGEPVHGVPAQAQDLGGFPLGAPGLQQLVHGGVPFAGARYQGPLAAVHVEQPVRPRRGHRGRASFGRLLARWRIVARGDRLACRAAGKAAAVRDDRLLGIFAHVVPRPCRDHGEARILMTNGCPNVPMPWSSSP